MQGLMVAKGNPKGIHTLQDVAEKKARYINRQRGAGTRLLFDYLLKKEGIAEERVSGYEREMTTHMAVAAAIAGGSADAGMGVESAANAMDLDFIPIGMEEYDFAIPEEYIEKEEIRAFIKTLRSEAFRQELDKLGGYGLKEPGAVLFLKDMKDR